MNLNAKIGMLLKYLQGPYLVQYMGKRVIAMDNNGIYVDGFDTKYPFVSSPDDGCGPSCVYWSYLKVYRNVENPF